MAQFIHYTEFLKNKNFVRWQLAADEHLDEYWLGFIEQNPHLEDEINKAIDYLKTNGLNKSLLSDVDKNRLLVRIQNTITNTSSRGKKRRILPIMFASVAAMLIVALGVNIYLHFNKKPAFKFKDEFIVGSLLSNEDIQLISEEKSTLFESDIEVQVNEKGTASVNKTGDLDDETVDLSTNSLNKLIVPFGKRTKLNLPDGSVVWLNSGTVLQFPTKFSGKNREIFLASGEIYLEVSANKQNPFLVHTNDFNVKVYGTAFNLTAYSDSRPSVVLVEGSVSLNSKNKKELFINPSEQAILSSEGIFDTQMVDVNKYVSWKSGYLAFERTPMSEVLKQIGRYYNFSFDFEKDVNLQKRTCTGKIYLSDNLDNVLTAIGLLTSTKYEKIDNQIYIINK